MKMSSVVAALMMAAPVLGAASTAKNTSAGYAEPSLSPAKAAEYSERLKVGTMPASTIQSASYNRIGDLWNAYSYFGFAKPFTYDATSNLLITVKRGGTQATTGFLYALYSTDMGSTWQETQLYDGTSGAGRFPSVAVLNPNGSTDPSGVELFFYGPVLRPAGSPNATFEGGIVGLGPINSAFTTWLKGPDEPAGSRQMWSTHSDVVPVGGSAHMVSMLSPETGVQYGYFGYLGLSLEGEVTSRIPWDIGLFRPSTEVNSSFNGRPAIEADGEGNLHMCTNGLFLPEETVRVPGISKSTDGGNTWSAFDIAPKDLWLQYAEDNGGKIDSVRGIWYDSEGFVVLPDGSASFICKSYLGDPMFHITELSRDAGGSWSIRKVSDWTGFSPNLIARDQNDLDTTISSSIDNELQLTTTADGQYLVAKWLDFKEHTVDGETTLVSDVFIAVRPASGGEWKTLNATDDALFNKMSWISEPVPSLENIPLLTVQTIVTGDPNTGQNLVTLQRDVILPQGLAHTNVDASTLTSVEETTAPAGSVAFSSVAPNPMSAGGVITLKVDVPQRVTVELVSVTGQRVATLHDGVMANGFHALTVPSVGSGMYRAVARFGANTISTPVSVVR